MEGIEPSWPAKGRGFLKPLRLPFRHIAVGWGDSSL